MESINGIKKRIGVISMIDKISQAMELVSIAKIKSIKSKFEDSKKFTYNTFQIMSELINSASNVNNKYLKKINDSKKKLYVLISSSMGLCGSYNITICKFLLNLLDSNDDIIVIGQGGFNYLRSCGYRKQIISFYRFDLNDNFSMIESAIGKKIISDYFEGLYDNIFIVYTSYINALKFSPKIFSFLPIDKTFFTSINKINPNTDLNSLNQVISYEPNKEKIFINFLLFFFSSFLHSCCIESTLCEFSARQSAMKNANDNVKKIKNELMVKYNQIRQEKITQEINEIISGRDIS